jgi:hypothetical protein
MITEAFQIILKYVTPGQENIVIQNVCKNLETKFGTGLSCHFAVDKLHSVLQSLFQVFSQNH